MQALYTEAASKSYLLDHIFPNFKNSREIFYQLSPQELISQSIEQGEGIISDTGALMIDTGEFTGRSPKDRFIVKEDATASVINWNEFNLPVEEKYFDSLLQKTGEYLKYRKLWVRDCYAGANSKYRVRLRVINENPCCNLFACNMFLRKEKKEGIQPVIDWHLLQVPHFFANPVTDGVPNKNFVIIHLSRKIILIGGTQYTGEMKKAVFSILNFILPCQHKVLSMHCAANIGIKKDTAIFFGLSGTGKTTLSADPTRRLIGDDEHGWDDECIFNFEGGCYAKTINLSKEHEPDIYNAIRYGAVVENTTCFSGTRTIDFASKEITENTRVSYPIDYINNAVKPSIGPVPKNIFFLVADAYGILPPVSKLTTAQAMYHFISGYTAKIAGTETGIREPKPTFSACFGAPFIPLHPATYAAMLGEKIADHKVNVWMINTGWTGGGYGTGSRIKLIYTRAMIAAALEGELTNVSYRAHPIFGMMIPEECPGVPKEILNPELSWADNNAYHGAAHTLARYFTGNFEKYKEFVSPQILAAGPVI